MNTVLAAVVALAALSCIFAVFYDGFKDNLGQRVGLAVMTLSLYPIGAQVYRMEPIGDGALMMLATGFTLFVVSTVIKPHRAEQQTASSRTPVHH